MDPIQLDQLNDYIFLDIFKYLDIKDRLRLERVSKRWRQLLERVWFAENVLLVSGHLFLMDINLKGWCHDRDHKDEGLLVRAFGAGSCQTLLKDRDMVLKVLTYCSNLKTLDLTGMRFELSPDFGLKLAQMCPLLEHIVISDYLWLQIYVNYAKTVDENQIKCITVTRTFANFVSFAPDFCDLLILCPKVSSINTGKPFIGIFLNCFLSRLVSFHGNYRSVTFEEQLNISNLFQSLTESRDTLESLCLQDKLLGSDIITIGNNFHNLKKIGLHSDLSDILYLSHLQKLEEISWTCRSFSHFKPKNFTTLNEAADDADFEEDAFYDNKYFIGNDYHCHSEAKVRLASAFQEFLATTRSKLRSISLDISIPLPDAFHSLPELCPHLDQLSLLNNVIHEVDIFDTLSALNGLKCLSINSNNVNYDNISQLLYYCTRLRNVTIFGVDFEPRLLRPVIELFNYYTTGCPKRVVKFKVPYSRWEYIRNQYTLSPNLRVENSYD